MVQVIKFDDAFYHPPELPGLKEVVRFPNGETTRHGMPNHTIWIFSAKDHLYQPRILSDDVGCGMTAFQLEELDPKEAADKIYEKLQGRNIIGRGNHFVEICSEVRYYDQETPDDKRNVLLLHTHGSDKSCPQTLEEAVDKMHRATLERIELALELSELVGKVKKMMGDWMHNTIHVYDREIIYRKGVAITFPTQKHILPANLGSTILVYTVEEKNQLPYSSMPHGTGRRAPRSETKVSITEAKKLRELVYIPPGISDNS